jgi:hypothetical protein
MENKSEQQTKADRKPVTHGELEHAIAENVKSNAECQAFVGVIVARTAPASEGGANWTVKGIRYGKANRALAAAALAKCVDEFQSEFQLSE